MAGSHYPSLFDDDEDSSKVTLHKALRDAPRDTVVPSAPSTPSTATLPGAAAPNEAFSPQTLPNIQRRDTRFLNADNLLGALTAAGSILLGGGGGLMALAGGTDKLRAEHEKDVEFNQQAQLIENSGSRELEDARIKGVWGLEEDVYRHERGLDKRDREPTYSLNSAMQVLASIGRSGTDEEFEQAKQGFAKAIPEFEPVFGALTRESAQDYSFGKSDIVQAGKDKDRLMRAGTEALKIGDTITANRLISEALGERTGISKTTWSDVVDFNQFNKLATSGYYNAQQMEAFVQGLSVLKALDPTKYQEALDSIDKLDPIEFSSKTRDLLAEAELTGLTPQEQIILRYWAQAQFSGIPGMAQTGFMTDPLMLQQVQEIIRKATANIAAGSAGATATTKTTKKVSSTKETSGKDLTVAPPAIKDINSEFDTIVGPVIDPIIGKVSGPALVQIASEVLNEAERKHELQFINMGDEDTTKLWIIEKIKEYVKGKSTEEAK